MSLGEEVRPLIGALPLNHSVGACDDRSPPRRQKEAACPARMIRTRAKGARASEFESDFKFGRERNALPFNPRIAGRAPLERAFALDLDEPSALLVASILESDAAFPTDAVRHHLVLRRI